MSSDLTELDLSLQQPNFESLLDFSIESFACFSSFAMVFIVNIFGILLASSF